MKFYLKNPAQWAGLIQAVVALVAIYVEIPVEAVLGLIAAATGLSFHAQKVENEKTLSALWTDPVDDDEDDLDPYR